MPGSTKNAQSTLTNNDTRQRFSPYSPRNVESFNTMAGGAALEMTKKLFKVTFPVDPRTAVQHLSKFLLEYEKSEILEYDQIYYVNMSERPPGKHFLTTPDGPENGGFDNDKGEYICNEKDHIAYRFEI